MPSTKKTLTMPETTEKKTRASNGSGRRHPNNIGLQHPKHIQAARGEIPPIPPIKNLPKVDGLQVVLPVTQAALIVGLDAEGNMYHTFVGDQVNVVALAGLQRYSQGLIDNLIQAVMPANVTGLSPKSKR